MASLLSSTILLRPCSFDECRSRETARVARDRAYAYSSGRAVSLETRLLTSHHEGALLHPPSQSTHTKPFAVSSNKKTNITSSIRDICQVLLAF